MNLLERIQAFAITGFFLFSLPVLTGLMFLFVYKYNHLFRGMAGYKV